MKTSFVPRLFVLLYLFISFSELLAAPSAWHDASEQTVVAPIRSESGSEGSHSSDSLEELRPSAKDFIRYLGDNWSSHPRICFYSGKTGTSPVWKSMDQISARLRCEWISSLLRMAKIPDTETKLWTDAKEWSETSRALAKIARNETIVILGQTYLEESVWKTVELPTLRSSKMMGWVTRINQYTMEDAAGKLAGPFEVL